MKLLAWILILCICVSVTVASTPSPAERRGDEAWQRRADGYIETGKIDPGQAAAAVRGYEEAVDADRDNVPLRLKLIEALYFQGHFTVAERKAKKNIYDHAVKVAEETVDIVAAAVGNPKTLRRMSLDEQAEVLKAAPHAAAAHFWAAISWGLWGMSHSRAIAGMKNVAGKIRDHSRILTLIDPGYADAGGLRLLGRLHTATPRIPLFTGWIDRKEGIELLRRANAISTADARNPMFLAEAILAHAPEEREEALGLLRDVASRSPDPDRIVEDGEILEEARALLARHETQPEGKQP